MYKNTVNIYNHKVLGGQKNRVLMEAFEDVSRTYFNFSCSILPFFPCTNFTCNWWYIWDFHRNLLTEFCAILQLTKYPTSFSFNILTPFILQVNYCTNIFRA